MLQYKIFPNIFFILDNSSHVPKHYEQFLLTMKINKVVLGLIHTDEYLQSVFRQQIYRMWEQPENSLLL